MPRISQQLPQPEGPTALGDTSTTSRKLTQAPGVQSVLGGSPPQQTAPSAPRRINPASPRGILGISEDEEDILGFKEQLGVVEEYIKGIHKLTHRPAFAETVSPGFTLKAIQSDKVFSERLRIARETDTAAVQARARSQRSAATASRASALGGVSAFNPTFEERPRLRSPLSGGFVY